MFCEKTLPENSLTDGQDLFPYLKPPLDTFNLVPRVPGNEVEIPCDARTK